ncbi:MAG: SPOR domain-containing protein [Castellaniella sp.]
MARKARKSRARSGGSTGMGIMIGLVLGLVAAVIVALFVTRVPMPFADKASRAPAQTLLPELRDAPDPNRGLYGKSALPEAVPMMPPPLSAEKAKGETETSGDDELAALISRLDPPVQRPSPAQGGVREATVIPGVTTTPQYYLQAGAFRSAQDAESVRARILVLGLPARLEQAQLDGATINRVRVGPFAGIDDMNRARSRLGEQNIESTVVRQ